MQIAKTMIIMMMTMGEGGRGGIEWWQTSIQNTKFILFSR